jgi:hypothetical protein
MRRFRSVIVLTFGIGNEQGSGVRLRVPASIAVLADPSASHLGRDASLSGRERDRVSERVFAGATANLSRDRVGPAQLGGRDAVIAVGEEVSLLRVEHDDRLDGLARLDVVLDSSRVEMRNRIDVRARQHVLDS